MGFPSCSRGHEHGTLLVRDRALPPTKTRSRRRFQRIKGELYVPGTFRVRRTTLAIKCHFETTTQLRLGVLLIGDTCDKQMLHVPKLHHNPPDFKELERVETGRTVDTTMECRGGSLSACKGYRRYRASIKSRVTCNTSYRYPQMRNESIYS